MKIDESIRIITDILKAQKLTINEHQVVQEAFGTILKEVQVARDKDDPDSDVTG